ncbi:methyltransferase [Brevundimonas sp.]|uniref:class I SAM-dependent methyltransferase n=1 Tax=Brevundimonas sp. TaxID=1871086 RepID=UPI0028A00683|nr:methyltransferase [Brevundimonas sp.]
MTSLIYGRPPAVFDPPQSATQTSPLIPGSQALESMADGSAEEITVYAPPGAVERRYVLAQALRVLKVGGRLDVMAPKDKGGSRLAKELKSFGLTFSEEAKAHHRSAKLTRPEQVEALAEAIKGGAPRIVPGLEAWSQPGIFAWDRIDTGTALLADALPALKGKGIDLGCGYGALATVVLRSTAVTNLSMVDLDRRAIDAAQQNVSDERASFEWADVRTLEADGTLDFVVSNPPFHDGGIEDKRLGQKFIRKSAELLKKGGVAWIVANRHLPYEKDLNEVFKRVTMVADQNGFKIFEAIK